MHAGGTDEPKLHFQNAGKHAHEVSHQILQVLLSWWSLQNHKRRGTFVFLFALLAITLLGNQLRNKLRVLPVSLVVSTACERRRVVKRHATVPCDSVRIPHEILFLTPDSLLLYGILTSWQVLKFIHYMFSKKDRMVVDLLYAKQTHINTLLEMLSVPVEETP